MCPLLTQPHPIASKKENYRQTFTHTHTVASIRTELLCMQLKLLRWWSNTVTATTTATMQMAKGPFHSSAIESFRQKPQKPTSLILPAPHPYNHKYASVCMAARYYEAYVFPRRSAL